MLDYLTSLLYRDESITNGHVENGPESPQPDSPSPSGSPNSPTSPEPVSSTEPLTNGTADMDTSKESIEQGTPPVILYDFDF